MKKQTNNTFGKGMNLDIPNYQYPSDILSYCRNCNYLTGEGNESILQNVKGNIEIDGLKENYFPVAIKEYGGVAYIVSAEVENNTFTGRGEIGTFPSPDYTTFTLKDSRTLVGNIDYQNPKYSPIKNYFKEDLDNTDVNLINEDLILYGTAASSYGDFNTELFNFTEFTEFDIELQPSYDDTINIIFTDNINPIRVVNTRFTPLPNNVVEIRDRLGSKDTNLYSKDNFDNTLNLSQSSTKIVNLDLDSISLGGQLKSGVYNYYLKYATQDGNTTNIIAESFPVPIFHGTTLSDLRGGDLNFLVETKKLVRLALKNLDTNFNSIRVQFSYSSGDDAIQTEYYEIDVDYRLSADSIVIEHTGREPLFTISREELDVDYVSLYTCKTLTQINNRLYAGNIQSKFYDQTVLEDYASQVRVGHTQRRIDIPFSSPIVDDNSIYSSKLINKIDNSRSSLSVGYKNGYYNPHNTYYYLPYYPGEKYAYSLRYVLDDGSMSDCFPVRGIDNFDNNKYEQYGDEVLEENNDYFSLTNGENLRGLYRFPQRDTSNGFANKNGDVSYSLLDSSGSVTRTIDKLGDGIRENTFVLYNFTDRASKPELQVETLQDYYFNLGGTDPDDPAYIFSPTETTYSDADCAADPNCTRAQEFEDCLSNPNCSQLSTRAHDCDVITEDVVLNPLFPVFTEVVTAVVCDGDEYSNTFTEATVRILNQQNEFGDPLGTTYTYTALNTNDTEANIMAVTFELPEDVEYPEGTIGVQFMRSTINSKDVISQGYLIDTLPVPSIDIYGKEESGNRYTDYKFFDGGMKLVPALDYVLESPAAWDRKNRRRNGRKERAELGEELSGVKFNSKGWDNTKPYDVYKHFAFISNDLICNPAYVASALSGTDFNMQVHNLINFYTSINTNSAVGNHFSLYKTIGNGVSKYDNTLLPCSLDWVDGNISSKTPNGYSSRCLFSGTTTPNVNNGFSMFPLKYNNYVGITLEDEIKLSSFSASVEDDILGEKLQGEASYNGGSDTHDSRGIIKSSGLLVSLYDNLGFEIGTNEDDLARIRQNIRLEGLAYTPITKRVYWEDNKALELDSLSVNDISEGGKVIAYGGDNFLNLSIRKLFNNIFEPDKEALVNEARDGKIGYSLTLINDSIYNPMFRTIEIPNQAEAPLNYYPNVLSTSPNTVGNNNASGNQWRDYQDLESAGFNFGGLKTYTDKSYITLVGLVPFLNNNFSTRIMYSELHVNSAIENGYRNFLPSAYRDYSKEMGAITAIRTLNNSNNYIVSIQENGTSLIPVADRSLLSQADLSTSAGQLIFEEAGILPAMDRVQILSKVYGTKWLDSVVVSNSGVYFVDIENTKVIQLTPNISLLSDYSIQSFLLKVKDTFSYQSVNLLSKNIYGYHHLRDNNVHFTFKESVCASSQQAKNPYAWEVNYTTLQEYNNGILTGNEKPNVESDPDYVPIEVVEQQESPCPFVDEPPFPLDVDIFVIWDTTSFNPSIKATLKTNVVYPWLANFRATYPQWVGNFNEIDAPATTKGEQWLDWASFIPPYNAKKAILIAMVDEAHNAYHDENVPGGWGFNGYTLAQANTNFAQALTTIGTTTPQTAYITDYNNFINLYNTYFDYFRGIVYAIPSAPNDLPNLFASFQLHAYAAIEGEVVPTANFIGSQQGNIEIIKAENQYSTLGLGLKHYGWQEQHNFTGQATDLTLTKFTEDINPLILETNDDNFTGWKVKLSSGECTPLYKTECLEVINTLNQNISFSEPLKVWNSFWGYTPSYAFNLYNKHYTLNGINPNQYNSIWLHNVNDTRCNFYGNQDEFVFEFVVADNIQYQKMYNNFMALCNEVPPIIIEYTTDNEPTIDDIGINPTKEPRIQTIRPRYRGRYKSSYLNQADPTLNSMLKFNAQYKENHLYIQIDDDNNDTLDGYGRQKSFKTNSAIRDKYLKVRFRYKGDEYSIIQAIITAYEISFS